MTFEHKCNKCGKYFESVDEFNDLCFECETELEEDDWEEDTEND